MFATYEGRCEQHRRKAWQNKSHRNRVLDPAKWQRVAAAHLAREPACRACRSAYRVQVDHITELADGGAMYDEENLQTLCETHHIQKSREERKLRRLRRQLAEED